jgi:hypothetical protein
MKPIAFLCAMLLFVGCNTRSKESSLSSGAYVPRQKSSLTIQDILDVYRITGALHNGKSAVEVFDSFRNANAEPIIGTYYSVQNFGSYLDEGLELLRNRPKDEDGYYTVDFKQNGDIQFTSHIKEFGCMNGLCFIDKGSWKAKGNMVYELALEGRRLLENHFVSVLEYSFLSTTNEMVFLKPNMILTHRVTSVFN